MYSKIDYEELKKTASNALSDLTNKSLDSIEQSLFAQNVLPKDIKTVIQKAFSDIEKNASVGNIALLKAYLKKIDTVSDDLKKYQNKQHEIDDFREYMDYEKASHRKKLRKLKKELNNIKSSLDSLVQKDMNEFYG